MSWQDRIAIDPGVMGGKPVIKGTRVPVQVIVGSLAGGETMEGVCAGYGVTEDDVRAALAYATEVLGQERLHALRSVREDADERHGKANLHDANPPLDKGWARLLQNVALAKYHDRLHMLDMSTMPNPLLDKLLPTLLFVQLTSFLDEALEAYRNYGSICFTPKTKQDLYHRIELLRDRLGSPDDLHGLRTVRGDLAHKPEAFVQWQDLDDAVDLVDGEFQHLGMIGTRPIYDFFAERSSAQETNDPRYLFEFEYQYGLKQGADTVLAFKWKSRVAKDE